MLNERVGTKQNKIKYLICIENAFSELLNDFTMYLIILCDYANSISLSF